MVTIDDALQHLGIDYPDEVIIDNVTRAMKAAESTLKGAVGADVWELMKDDGRPEQLLLTYMDDLYSERGVSAKVSGATRRMVAAMELQLQLELRQLRGGA